jgi:hypothetical protein
MSKLAELLHAQKMRAATPATSATRQPKSSRSSESSRGPLPEQIFSPELARRIRAMARRWQYSETELAEVLNRARVNPEAWLGAVTLDERREAEFRERGLLLPREDA